MTKELTVLMLTPSEIICTRCEATIPCEDAMHFRKSEETAPYAPSPYCSAECVEAADEDAYEHAMNRGGM